MAIFGYDPIDQELNNYNLRKTRESQFKAVRKVIEEKPQRGATPGPSNYHPESRKEIGD